MTFLTRVARRQGSGRSVLPLLTLTLLILLVAGNAKSQSGRMHSVTYGTVVSVEQTRVQARSHGRRARTGRSVGAIAGAAIADRGDGLLGALIGGAIGGAIGRSADRRKSTIEGKELIIRLDSGEEVMIETTDSSRYFSGDRVQLIGGANGTRVRRVRR